MLSEVELICDRVAILNKGSLVKEGKVGEITSASNNYKFITSEISEKNINDLLINFKAVIHSRNEFVYNTINIEDLNKIIDFLRENKILIHSVNREKDTLENMFINLNINLLIYSTLNWTIIVLLLCDKKPLSAF